MDNWWGDVSSRFFACCASKEETSMQSLKRDSPGQTYGLHNFGMQILSETELKRYTSAAEKWSKTPEKERRASYDMPVWPEDIHVCCDRGDEKGLNKVLKTEDAGFRLRSVDHYGRTALHVAAKRGHEAICLLILNSMPDAEDKAALVRKKTKDGFTAADIAEKEKHGHLLQLLVATQFELSTGDLVLKRLEWGDGLKWGQAEDDLAWHLRLHKALKTQEKILNDFKMEQSEYEQHLKKRLGENQNILKALQEICMIAEEQHEAKNGAEKSASAKSVYSTSGKSLRNDRPVSLSEMEISARESQGSMKLRYSVL